MRLVTFVLPALLMATPLSAAESAGSGTWTVGPNLGFSVLSSTEDVPSTFALGVPAGAGLFFGNVQPGNILGGALIAKIGSSNPFKVGSKHTFTVDKPGVLQFSIAIPGDYTNYQFPGEYQVKIRIVRKQ